MAHEFTLPELEAAIGSSSGILHWMHEKGFLHLYNRHCERCGARLHLIRSSHAASDGTELRCTKCSTRLSVRHGTEFAHSHLSLAELMRVLLCFDVGLSPTQSHYIIGLPRQTISTQQAQCRQLMDDYMKAHPVTFSADETVEIDEVLIDALREDPGRTTGWVFGLVARESNKLHVEQVPNREAATLLPIIQKHVERGATICSDDWGAYAKLKRDYKHFVVQHSHH